MNNQSNNHCLSVLYPKEPDRQTLLSSNSLVSLAKNRLAKIRTPNQQMKGLETLSHALPDTHDSTPEMALITLIEPASETELIKVDSLLSNATEGANLVLARSSQQGVDITPFSGPYAKLIHAWISQALEEGHIEPSQSSSGVIVGWPIRPYAKRSLLVDFDVCCMRNGLPAWDKTRSNHFVNILDLILDPKESFYLFPPLEECRRRFEKLDPYWKGNETL